MQSPEPSTFSPSSDPVRARGSEGANARPSDLSRVEGWDDPEESTKRPLSVAQQRIKDGTAGEKPAPYNWNICTVAELVMFRDQINATLPPTELSKLNLEEEMLLQYHTLRELQGLVLQDNDVPVNQRAQVANSVAATLKTLGDQQTSVYSSERFKQIENLLIRSLSTWPEKDAAEFLIEYEKIIRKG